MARASTTADVFNAIAEPRRREILDLLARDGQKTVNELVDRLGGAQPAMSKHLSVLRQVGLVAVHKDGPHRRYEFQPQELRQVHDWVKHYERFWTNHLDRVKDRAERKARERAEIPPEDPAS